MNEKIYAWINAGLVKSDKYQQALELAGARPGRSAWLQFVSKSLLLMGLLSLAFGVIFFFAYNWNEMSRMVKFGLAQLALLGVFLLYLFKANSPWFKQSLLLVVTLLVGALLALFGQTYQTGADPWQLFATWAVLILPVVLFSRSEVLWVVFVLLLNLSLVLYLQINRSLFGLVFFGASNIWLFLMLNMVLLFWLEWLSEDSHPWFEKMGLKHRWAAQVIGLVVLFILSIVGMEGIWIWGDEDFRTLNLLIFMAVMAGAFAFYRFVRKDLLLLTAWALAVMFFVLVFLGDSLFKSLEAGGFLLLAMTLIGMSAYTVKWIKELHQAFNQGEQS